jgi:hypothetical protein
VHTIGSYMKLAYKTWNREHYVSDEVIKNDLDILSNGRLSLDENSRIDGLANSTSLCRESDRNDRNAAAARENARGGGGQNRSNSGGKDRDMRGGGSRDNNRDNNRNDRNNDRPRNDRDVRGNNNPRDNNRNNNPNNRNIGPKKK